MTGSVPSSFQRSHGVIWLDNFAMQNNRGKHFVDLQADNSLIAKNLNVFRGTSSLETRCLTLKTYTVTVYLSKWKPYYQIDYLSCFIFQSKNLEYAITLKAYLWDIYRTFINFLHLQNRGHRSCDKRITNVCILSFDSLRLLLLIGPPLLARIWRKNPQCFQRELSTEKKRKAFRPAERSRLVSILNPFGGRVL